MTHLWYWHIPLARLLLPLLLHRVTQNFGPAHTLAIQQVRRDGTVRYSIIVGVLVRSFLVHRDSERRHKNGIRIRGRVVENRVATMCVCVRGDRFSSSASTYDDDFNSATPCGGYKNKIYLARCTLDSYRLLCFPPRKMSTPSLSPVRPKNMNSLISLGVCMHSPPTKIPSSREIQNKIRLSVKPASSRVPASRHGLCDEVTTR